MHACFASISALPQIDLPLAEGLLAVTRAPSFEDFTKFSVVVIFFHENYSPLIEKLVWIFNLVGAVTCRSRYMKIKKKKPFYCDTMPTKITWFIVWMTCNNVMQLVFQYKTRVLFTSEQILL